MKDYELITKVITCNYKYVNITYFTSYLYYLACASNCEDNTYLILLA